MGLTGSSNEEKIWNYLVAKGLSKAGAAGLMGNLQAESGLKPTNLQNSYETKLGYTDDSYTTAVDSGAYGNFIKDSAGYGLAQWTYWSRKQNMLNFARAAGKSIGDLEMQLDFLFKELTEGYKSVLAVLKTAQSVKTASDSVLLNYERPADQSEAVKTKRASYGQTYYDKYAGTGKTENGGTTMSNSSLVTYTNITKTQKNSPRNHAIDTVTIHCVVGQWTAKQICDYFANADRGASCNYGVGKDGSIGLNVDEKDRAWTSSNGTNDNRAITIEVASDTTSPYAITDAAYNALINLLADICKRNGIKKLVWSDSKSDRVNHKNGVNMTCHRDFANKSCPGDYIYSREGAIAEAVNKKLGATTSTTTTTETVTSFPATPFTVKVIISDLNYRSEPSMSGTVKGQTGKGTFTITQVKDGWGKLKSGAGWIYIANPEYCTVQGTTSTTTTTTTTTTATKSVTEIAKEVIAGKWGNGGDRKKRLEAAGYNYGEVQRKVNELMK